MKIRESGMPDENYWNSFFDVNFILKELEINSTIENVVEIGCGYGTFTIPVSKIIKGKIFAFDIENEMIKNVSNKMISNKIYNIQLINKDVISESTELENNTIDYVMLFNILHHERPEQLLKEANRILKKNGKIGILHWRTDIETPRGPSLEIRTKPNSAEKWITENGFEILKKSFIIEPYHFGILATKS